MTTEYVLIPAKADGSAPLTPGVESLTITGRPGGTLMVGTGDDQAGTYFDGSTYQTSSFFTGLTVETKVVIVNNSDFNKDRVLTVYFNGARPSTGKHSGEISLFKEDADNDDGICWETIGGEEVKLFKYQILLS